MTRLSLRNKKDVSGEPPPNGPGCLHHMSSAVGWGFLRALTGEVAQWVRTPTGRPGKAR